MSRENVEIVSLAASGRTDLWDPNAELLNFESAPYTKPYRGLKGLRDWLRDASEDLDDFEVSVGDLVAAEEDRVVGTIRLTGRAKASGVQVDFQFASVWTVRGGKIVKAQGYLKREQALEAVGLRDG